MKLTRKSRLQLSLQKFIFLLLFISSIAMLAWITQRYNYQFDLTANQRHSLSNSSIELLDILDKDVTVHAYTMDDVTKKAVKEIIHRYQQVKSDFNLRLLHPDLNIDQAKSDGIVMDKRYAFVVHYNNRMEHLQSLSEQAISNALLRLNRHNNQQIVFLTGHGERSLEENIQGSYSKLKQQLTDTGIKLSTLNLLNATIPVNTKLLVIAAPSHDYLPGEIKQIDSYIKNGGNLLWLSDPGPLFGLDKQATSLGLQLQDNVIVDNNPDLRRTLSINNAAIIPVTEYFPHTITKTLRYNTVFTIARGISPLTNENTVNHWKAEALFSSFGKSWGETGGIKEEMVFDSSEGDVAGPITIAVALHRKSVSKYAGSQRVVVVGDSDFLSDTYIGVGANLNLGLNIFNWLIGDDDFISVGAKPSPDTKLELNDTQLMVIAFGFFLIIPIVLLIIGFRIWYKRKNM